MSTDKIMTYATGSSVQAVQWSGENYREVIILVNSEVTFSVDGMAKFMSGDDLRKATIGKWIVRYRNGEVHVTSDGYFRNTYNMPEDK